MTVTGSGADVRVWSVIQRPLWNDPATPSAGTVDDADVARIGRLDPATGAWDWFGYRLDATTKAGDWMGLSEITAIDEDTFAIIERDKLNGPSAAVKRITRVEIPADAEGSAFGEPLTVLEKSTAIDVLPLLRATAGWTQEKLEGFAIAADGGLYAVTDNDGLTDATGETVFLRLGSAATAFPDVAAPADPALALSATSAAAGSKVIVTGSGFPASAAVRIELHSTPVVLGTTTTDADGGLVFVATIPASAPAGEHEIVAFTGEITAAAALTVTATSGGGDPDAADEDTESGSLADTGGDATGAVLSVVIAGLLLATGALLLRRRRA
ncbi:hypothetical protein GCM10027408_15730 [Microbacterium tumbae]